MDTAAHERLDPFAWITPEVVQDALERWDRPRALGTTHLAMLTLVEARCRLARQPSLQISARSDALRDILRGVIDKLKPDDLEPNPHDERWHLYLILTRRWFDGLKAKEVRSELRLPESTYFDRQQRALNYVADTLRRLEEEHQATLRPLECRGPFLAPFRSRYRVIGRETLREQIMGVLFRENRVLLRGVPGVGKTALALSLAYDHEVLNHFPDGVLWAGLGPQANAMAQLSLWGSELGIAVSELARAVNPSERAKIVRSRIGSQRMLMIIDDAWKSDELSLLLECCGQECACIITTRTDPKLRRFPDLPEVYVGELSEQDGMTLLRSIASKAVDRYPEEARELVHLVGFLPLALILVGHQLSEKVPAEEIRRIPSLIKQLHDAQERLGILVPQMPAGAYPSLQQPGISLEAVVEVSDLALSNKSSKAFRAISTFPCKPSSFSKEAALSIANCSFEEMRPLYEYGLIEYTSQGRYSIHQVIADYAQTRSDWANSSEHKLTKERFVGFFAGFVKSETENWSELDTEHTNIMAAINLAQDLQLSQEYIDISLALFPFLELKGLLGDAEKLLLQSQEAIKKSEDITSTVKCLFYRARVAHQQSSYPAATDLYESALAIAKNNSTLDLIAGIFAHYGLMKVTTGDAQVGETMLQEALSIAQSLGKQRLACFILQSLGTAAYQRSDFSQAATRYQGSLEIAQLEGDQERISSLFQSLGATAFQQGDYERADFLFKQGLTIARSIGHLQRVSSLLLNLGAVSANRSDYDQSEVFAREGLDISRRIGNKQRESLLLMNLGSLLMEQGEISQSEEFLLQGLDVARKIEHSERISHILLNLGHLEHVRGRYERSEKYIEESLEIARKINQKVLITELLGSQGVLMAEQNNFSAALGRIEESLTMARELGQQWLVCTVLYQKGEVYLKLPDYTQAKNAFSASQQIAEELASLYRTAMAQYGLARVAYSEGKFDVAKQLGSESVTKLRHIKHHRSSQVSNWLDGISNDR